MVLDHAGKAFAPLTAFPWHVAGRPALILFALVIAARLLADAGRARRYLPRLVLWGLAAQPGFMLLGSDGLNILFTFAAGVGALWLLDREGGLGLVDREGGLGLVDREGGPWRIAAALALLAAAGFVVEYGWIGAGLVPGLVLAGRRLPLAMPGIAALACFATQLPGPFWFLWPVAAACAAAAALAWLVRMVRIPNVRLPGVVFYAFYAGHLAVFGLLRALV